MAKFIFVTGGVVSGLGKGITAASLGLLLKARGYSVGVIKLDPYMNVDPGTMSPYQHGEVFVTEDGAETDLDLGHYERFVDANMNKYSNLTSGRVYWNVINKERAGTYLGSTVQVIPHITNEIKQFIYDGEEAFGTDIMLIEIGGTTGDIESSPFLEAMRQIRRERKHEDTISLHVALIPYLGFSAEHKTKPVQHSVKELQASGIFPDVILARTEMPIARDVMDKIALFCNVRKDCVVENLNVDVLYEAPQMLHDNGLDKVVCELLQLEDREMNMQSWNDMIKDVKSSEKTVNIALVGKYVQLHDAYLSVVEALKHAGFRQHHKVNISWIDSETVTRENSAELFKGMDGIIVPGGFGDRGIEGKIESARYCRETNTPYLGLCLGMQIMVIEFARNVCGIENANSKEFKKNVPHVINFLENQSDEVKKGGTLRLGKYPCKVKEGTKLHEAYGDTEIYERHRHRYEFNNEYRELFQEKGLVLAGTSPDELIVETVEITENDFYVGVQFHPEFKSRPNNPHPLFLKFIEKSIEGKK